MNKPSVFIIGAPKCGTTALAKYLGEHSSIFMSTPKEPHFFATNFNNSMRATFTEKHYLSLFKNAKENQICAEASVWYLYSQEAIKNIANFNSKAKIIIMLREPVDMIYSLHSQKLYSQDEDIEDFEKAWNLSWDREQGRNIPKKCRELKTLYYHKIADYFDQIQNVYKYFPKEQVKIILFDDFKKDNLSIYKDVLEFLNIEYDNKLDFEKVNERKEFKNGLLADMVSFRVPQSIADITMKIKAFFGIKSFPIWSHLLQFIRKINTQKKEAQPISNKMREIISNHYKDSYTSILKEINEKK